MAKNPRRIDGDQDTSMEDDRIAASDNAATFNEKAKQRREQAAEDATKLAEEEGRLPKNTAGANPAPSATMGSNGVFTEDAMKQAVVSAADHPSVENNPRAGTSAVQNGIDFNEPSGRDPIDPKFSGQGLDLSVYGTAKK